MPDFDGRSMLARLLDVPAFAGLPVVAQLSQLQPGRTVVQAPPGTGKTTAVPPAVADLVPGRVVVCLLYTSPSPRD